MCLRSSTGLGAKEGRAKKRLLVARVLETLRRLAKRARTAMRQPRQMCGEGIGEVGMLHFLCVLVAGFGEDRLSALGMRFGYYISDGSFTIISTDSGTILD